MPSITLFRIITMFCGNESIMWTILQNTLTKNTVIDLIDVMSTVKWQDLMILVTSLRQKTLQESRFQLEESTSMLYLKIISPSVYTLLSKMLIVSSVKAGGNRLQHSHPGWWKPRRWLSHSHPTSWRRTPSKKVHELALEEIAPTKVETKLFFILSTSHARMYT